MTRFSCLNGLFEKTKNSVTFFSRRPLAER